MNLPMLEQSLEPFWARKPEYDTAKNRATLQHTVLMMLQSPSNTQSLGQLTAPGMLDRIFSATQFQYEVRPEPVAPPEPEPELPPTEPENPLAAARNLHEAIAIQERLAIEAREDYQRRRRETNLGQSEGQRKYNETFQRVSAEQFGKRS